MDYKCFGDAVSFDTTFQTNKFEMPFARILGTNHHKQTIFFGWSLLFNETIPSFVWLFESFLKAMSGKHPSIIFKDQVAAMAIAIAHVFPNMAHRLCLWHIGQNAIKHLSPIIKEAEDEAEDKPGSKFWAAFKSCIYRDRAESYFTKKWDELLAKYNLKENSGMSNIYALRAKWTSVYRVSFTVDMHSTQRSEGMNNVFKKRFRRKLSLSELLVECENVIVDQRSNEKDADFESRRKIPVCYIQNLPMLKTAAETYTRIMHAEFEEEFKKQFTLNCELLETNGTNSTFFVKYMQSECGATVVLNNENSTITCSCRMFECIGMLSITFQAV
jgi:zinc finger SWIM domain-containing protein 3